MGGSGTSQRLVAGRYRLVGVLGRGGLGVVWRGTDETIGRPVAVKELRAYPGGATDDRAVVGERALREARSAGRINHPGVVAVHDLVPATDDDDAVYIVMELVEAPTLADVLAREGALPASRVTALAIRLLEVLTAAHRIGVVHRDVKPGNIMVLPDDAVKVVDFGIAHSLDDTRLTRDGAMGSAGYMAPELFHGKEITTAVDLWSLGATLFHAVEGHGPFERESSAATMVAVLNAPLPTPTCGPPLATVITGMLDRAPDRRMTGPEALAALRPDGQDSRAAVVPPEGSRERRRTAIAPVRPKPPTRNLASDARSRLSRRELLLPVGIVAAAAAVFGVPRMLGGGSTTSPPATTASAVASAPLAGAKAFPGGENIRPVEFSPDGRALAINMPDDRGVRLWALTDATGATAAGQVLPDGGHVKAVAFAPDGKILAVARADNTRIELWDGGRPRPARTPRDHARVR